MAAPGPQFVFSIDVLVGEVERPVIVLEAGQCAEKDVAAAVGRPDDLALLTVVKERLAGDLSVVGIADGTEEAVVVAGHNP